MSLEKHSPCKVNLLLNILGKRPDGFHELETVMHPVNLCDTLHIAKSASGVALTCSDPTLPTDSRNLVHRAVTIFLSATGLRDGVKIHLEKKIPMAAGLGGGSGNAAMTLLGLNELFGSPLTGEKLREIASALGSDVPFFLQSKPAVGTGRGEKVQSLESFLSLRGTVFFLVHPGFGISTPWAYQNLARFPNSLNGQAGRANRLITKLQSGDLRAARDEFYNSLEAPALDKFPLLVLFQEFLRANGAAATLMSGSGSTTFAIVRDLPSAETLRENFLTHFGPGYWIALVPV
jgi:4-diphosphocytidyl-2-C-methyl-D-erythritol kinase